MYSQAPPGSETPAPAGQKLFGKYTGYVEKNQDDERGGKLYVTVPDVLGPTKVWARPCLPYAGAGVGLFMMPEKGRAVWIEFEAGDPAYPIWTGCQWEKNEAPESDPKIKMIKTETMELRFSDADKELTLRFGNSVRVTLRDDAVTLEVSGGAKLEMSGNKVSLNGPHLEVT
ncbi:hypothetical protein ATO10_02930 [Actibacterium atlanticum]|uniref:Gp5/Type VI secretion system Vgr protein OB-fold domain-containing protein n=1 Tax=Actibacterium atlanticum TaxID=1461693 RepID=A0A058ZR32_9RHOB|nr:phage baseplate assembly protein V [Actibacterium atlanticum]KCV83680.1 hypothetical protein ATO10_02930 [Actibacterium atlanticum]